MAIGDKIVTHPGVVKQINGNKISVSVISKAGCASCQIKDSCSVGEVEEKIVEMDMPHGFSFKEGQMVTVEMKQSLGTFAVLLGYVFPFVVILLSLILFIRLGIDQGLAGIFSLATLVPYYGALYLSKDYFRKKFRYNLY
jgi:sigma-E factor negative regulatory protein RseC